MNITLLKPLRAIARADGRHLTTLDLIGQWQRDPSEIGRLIWDKCQDRREMVNMCGDWPGWPECQCTCCDCDEPATCTDDGGIAVCDACQGYTTDDNGTGICSRDDRAEIVHESCGAGNQMRSYVRLKPPEMPETDDAGEYALYWETVGDDAHIVARFPDYASAAQAVAAKDWPRPGDTTAYLCGFSVRQLIDGVWVAVNIGV